MDGLADKRVGIIGTGATAVQCIPHLARARGELFVFQRTPSSIDVRANEPTDPEWFERESRAGLAGAVDGQLRRRADRAASPTRTWSRTAGPTSPGASATGSSRTRDGRPSAIESFQQAFEDCDDEKMDEIRARVDAIVGDEATAAALKPWYRQLCKRPCFHDEYLDAYNEPGTHLIDTDGQGVERITTTGVVVAGVEYELDCIIFASGFEVGTEQARRTGFDPVGPRRRRPCRSTGPEGMRTLHGMHVHGFPNVFILRPPRAPT